MTQKKLLKNKRRILAERDRQDLETIKKRRVPLWRRALYHFGIWGPKERWLDRWQKTHDAALKIATRRALNSAISLTIKRETRTAILRNAGGKLAKGRV